MLLEAAVVAFLAAAPVAASVEQEVRDVEAKWNAAYAANDLPTYWSYYDAAATMWLAEGRVPLATYKKDWNALIAGGGKVLSNVLKDVEVHVSPAGDAAVATYLVTVATRYPDGKVVNDVAQETDVLFKKDGKWKVVHVHYETKPAKK
jgi:ketosteroid isomerase-like protein